jgi:hypothetical protein
LPQQHLIADCLTFEQDLQTLPVEDRPPLVLHGCRRRSGAAENLVDSRRGIVQVGVRTTRALAPILRASPWSSTST